MRGFTLFFSLSLLFVCLRFQPVNISNSRVKKIVIDAGHGGKDVGCLGKKTKESHVALAVALEVATLLEKNMKDVKVILTRDKDEFVELHDRAGIANKNNASLFVSIHCNASLTPTVFGSETYTMGLHTSDGNLEVAKRENAVILQEENYLQNYNGYDPNSPIAHILLANYQNANLGQSVKLAQYIEDQFKTSLGRHSRGVKQAGFLVLWKTIMPSVLVEIGYLTNEDDEKFLKQPENQYKVAEAIFLAIQKYKQMIETN